MIDLSEATGVRVHNGVARNRKVVVSDDEAVRVIETRDGRRLYLFDESQTSNGKLLACNLLPKS